MKYRLIHLMRTQRAFSLIEALIVLSIMAVLLTATLPSLKYFSDKTQDDVVQLNLLRAIQLARQTALMRHTSVSFCKSKNHRTCSGNWGDGQLLFIDTNGDGVVRHPHQIIAVMQIHLQRGELFWHAFPFYRDYLHFSANGIMHGDNGAFWYCHKDTTSPRWAIFLSKTGSTRVILPGKDGMIKDGHGKRLLCSA